MLENNYTVYHLHTMLSNGVTNIDSVTNYKQYIDVAASLNMKSIAFSEHGSVFEWVHKKQYAEEKGLKYIHAMEAYLTEDSDKDNKHRDNYHCVLIAKNYDGVKELNKLSSMSFNRKDHHYYYAPRITFEELFDTSDNILITSACLGGALGKGNDNTRKRFMKFMIENKHRCYLEIQHHSCEAQASYNKIIYAISKKTGIPLIAGTDTHCLNQEHKIGRDILQKGKGVFFSDEDGWDLTFKTYDELVSAYEIQNALPREVYLKAIEETNNMADKIETFELDYSKKYPKLYNDSEKVLKQKIANGIVRRSVNKSSNFNEYKNRIAYELETYKHNGAIDFLLLEEDYKTELRKQNVYCGYSRGSCSGSIICYLLGITDVDSIKYNLNFERFMSKERVSLADIDSDWSKRDRYKVREYLFKKDGLYCCDIITFNTIALKGAIKDVGRALGMSVDETQAISNAVYLDENKKDCIDESYLKRYPELFKYVDIVKGTIVSIGNHPAGLVVSPFKVDEAFGLCSTSTNENMISQINMKEIDCQNYVKLDVLGLDCVGLINETCELANIERITPDNISFDDEKVWNEIKEDTTMIFQFESAFSGDYLKTVLSDSTLNNIRKRNPNFSYIDLMSMANGAIRPAGASYREALSNGEYYDNHNKELNDFLSPTLGYLVFQEQILEFLHRFCGYTMGEADIVRRGFAKKTGTEQFIPKIKDGFRKTMKEQYNVSEEESDEIIEAFLKVIANASLYAFSKNHSDPYSFLGYVVGWLRCYYKLETVTTALNIYMDDSDKSVEIISYANRNNITIKPIKFGKSGAEYTMDKENNAIYKGIKSIKYCSSIIAKELLELSKEKEYASFIELLDDISSKTSVDSRQLRILTGLNFFSDFGNNEYLLKIIDLHSGIKEKSKTILPSFRTCKTIKKNKINFYSQYGISEYLAKKYSNKDTPAQYSEIDNIGLLNEVMKNIPNKPMSIQEQCKFEKTYLEYITYTNTNMADDYYIVSEYTTYKDSCKPYFVARNIKTGEEIKSRIKQAKIYRENPFGEFSILKIEGFETINKVRYTNNEKVVLDETEEILERYEVIKQ